MKRLLLILLLVPVIVIAQSMGGGQAFRNIARAWLLDPPSANTFVPSQYGMGWSDSKFTLRTPAGAMQFTTTGDPPEAVVTWEGRIIAEHIDVTSMSLDTTVPASSESPGTVGQTACDGSYIYKCTALNTWKRAALTTW